MTWYKSPEQILLPCTCVSCLSEPWKTESPTPNHLPNLSPVLWSVSPFLQFLTLNSKSALLLTAFALNESLDPFGSAFISAFIRILLTIHDFPESTFQRDSGTASHLRSIPLRVMHMLSSLSTGQNVFLDALLQQRELKPPFTTTFTYSEILPGWPFQFSLPFTLPVISK